MTKQTRTKLYDTYEELTAKIDELERTDNVNLIDLVLTAQRISWLESQYPELGQTSTMGQIVRDKKN